MSIRETYSVINIFPQKKAPVPDGFPGELHPLLEEKMVSVLNNLFQKIQSEGTVPNSFCEPGHKKSLQKIISVLLMRSWNWPWLARGEVT